MRGGDEGEGEEKENFETMIGTEFSAVLILKDLKKDSRFFGSVIPGLDPPIKSEDGIQMEELDYPVKPDNDRHSSTNSNTKGKQLFRMDTKVSCSEEFGTTRNVRIKADIIIKKGGGEPGNQD